jgi:7-carboxy-7-deazaguanine synthase
MHLSEVQSMLGELMAKHRVSTVAITGGEPMHYPKQMMVLAGWLREMKVRSWLETSGVIVSPEVFDCFDFVSFDVKTPSSGPACFDTDAVTKFRETVLRYDAGVRGGIGQVKMIVTDQRDIDWINQHFGDWLDHPPLRSSVTHSSPGPIIITPACGKNSTPQEVAHRMQLAADAWVGKNVRIIAQQHAILGMR